jgi:hypothetical protein
VTCHISPVVLACCYSSAGPIVLLDRALEKSIKSDHRRNYEDGVSFSCQSSAVTISEETENLFALHYFSLPGPAAIISLKLTIVCPLREYRISHYLENRI